MLTAIKSFLSLKEMQKSTHEIQHDSDGRAIITMTVRDDSNFLSPYSVNNEEVIDSDVAEFIEHCANAIHPKYQLTLHIHSNCISPDEQNIYRDALRQYFVLKSVANQREIRRNRFLAVIMFLVGVAALGSTFFAESFGVKQLWIECIDIFAWVFIWEAVDLQFIEGGRLRFERKRLSALTNMKVNYFNINDQ